MDSLVPDEIVRLAGLQVMRKYLKGVTDAKLSNMKLLRYNQR